jgi:peptidoglycan/xylan/chitin deacetylase (PgdA/CDA1 family)
VAAAATGLAVGLAGGYAWAHHTAPRASTAAPTVGVVGNAVSRPLPVQARRAHHAAYYGPVQTWRRVPVTKPVVFVGIDDGIIRTPATLAYLTRLHLPASLFIPDQYLQADVPFWKAAEATGGLLEDHSVNHPDMAGMSLAGQEYQICTQADHAKALLGSRPTLFRPPYGAYDVNTLAAAQACGMHAVVLWDASVNDGVLRTANGGPLQAGDIILMHFRTTFTEDLGAVVRACQEQGLTVARLEDYLDDPAVLTKGPGSGEAGTTRRAGGEGTLAAGTTPTAQWTAPLAPSHRSASPSASPSAPPSASQRKSPSARRTPSARRSSPTPSPTPASTEPASSAPPPLLFGPQPTPSASPSASP